MGEEVYSIADLGGKLVTDESCPAFLMPLDMPFTAASVTATIEELTDEELDDVSIRYSGENNGLIVRFGYETSPEVLERAANIKTSLRADGKVTSEALEVLSLDCTSKYPQLVIEPLQVLTGAMFIDLIDRFTGKLAKRREDWTASVGWGAFLLEHLDDEDCGYDDDLDEDDQEDLRDTAIDYSAMALRVVAKYPYCGIITASCGYNEEDQLASVHHMIRVISPIEPHEFDLSRVKLVAGVVNVEVDQFNQVHVETAGSELFTFGDPRKFIFAVHALSVELAKALNIFPVVGMPKYSITLDYGSALQTIELSHHFDILSDRA